jgi:hypothetical protein
MLIPDEAIITKQSLKQVLVLAADGTVTARTIELGPEILGLRAVKDGLAPTDLVILDHINQLKPGMKVVPRDTAIEPRKVDAGRAARSNDAPEPRAATASNER